LRSDPGGLGIAANSVNRPTTSGAQFGMAES
jgi:hypothetical protein